MCYHKHGLVTFGSPGGSGSADGLNRRGWEDKRSDRISYPDCLQSYYFAAWQLAVACQSESCNCCKVLWPIATGFASLFGLFAHRVGIDWRISYPLGETPFWWTWGTILFGLVSSVSTSSMGGWGFKSPTWSHQGLKEMVVVAACLTLSMKWKP